MINKTEELFVVLAGRCADEYDSKIMTALLVESTRFRVAESADETLQICSSQLPDMVMIRHGNNLDGFDLTTKLRALVKPPHIILVGEGDDVTVWRKALEAGAAAYIPVIRIEDELGKSISRIGHAINLTRSHRASFTETDRTARVFEAFPFGALLVDGTGTVISANNAFIGLTGISTTSLKNSELKTVLGQFIEDRFPHTNELIEAVRQGLIWSGECRCYYSQHREGWASITITPLTPKDDPPYSLITVRDISEERRNIIHLLTAKGAAHDLLSGQGYAEPGNIQKLNSMLLGTGTSAAESSFNLKELLVASLGKDIPLDLSSSIPERLKGKAVELGATIKALAGWGRRSSNTGKAELSVKLRQRNSGSWQLMFTMFSEDRHTADNSYESADDHLLNHRCEENSPELRGIGLASWLVTVMGGSIIIIKTTKDEGKRASFSIWLEEISGHESVNINPESEGPVFESWSDDAKTCTQPGKTLRVLLAEDSPVDQASIKSMLQRLEYQVIAVENGHEAVEECEQNDFDLILMDILMPVMDGFEASRLIREREALSGVQTPIIALTSYSLKAVQEKCHRVGMNGYLPKPVSMNNLRKLMEGLSKPDVSEVEKPDALSATRDERLNILDKEHALEYTDGDQELYTELVNLFMEHAPNTMKELIDALNSEDVDSVEKSAHKLKGMASNIGAEQFTESTRTLMDMARNGELTDFRPWLERLPSEYSTLEKALKLL